MPDQKESVISNQRESDRAPAADQKVSQSSTVQRLTELARGPVLPSLSAIAIATLTTNPIPDLLPLCYGGGRHG
jgi:hypothetical protein